MFGFNWAPRTWALCQGQSLPLNQNQSLFALIGTFYGGNGTTTFNLPDLQGRTPLSQNLTTYLIGSKAGTETVNLISTQMPAHTHIVNAVSAAGTAALPTGDRIASAAPDAGGANHPIYAVRAALVALNTGSISSVGGSQPHVNMQPFLVLNFCIAMQGLFPYRV